MGWIDGKNSHRVATIGKSRPTRPTAFPSGEDWAWFEALCSNPNLEALPSVEASDGTVWKPHQTAIRLYLILIRSGPKHLRYREAVEELSKFRRAMTGTDEADLIPPAYRNLPMLRKRLEESARDWDGGESWRALIVERAQSIKVGPPGNAVVVRGPSLPMKTVRFNRIPFSATEHWHAFSWHPIPAHWFGL